MNETVHFLNSENGQRGKLPRYLFENPDFNDGRLVEVDPHQKPYVAELFKSRLTEPAIDPATVDEDPEPEEEDN